MTKTPNNFVKKLKKLDNYFILREEDEFFIIATKITIKEHIEIHYTFSTHIANKDKEFQIFFILGLNEDCKELNEFRKRELPILLLPKNMANSKIEEIQKYLDDFVKMKF
jgi:hypothetical protein